MSIIKSCDELRELIQEGLDDIKEKKVQEFSEAISEIKRCRKNESNSAMLAFNRVSEAFKGAAEKVGFEDEAAMQDYMKEIRKEVRGD